MAGDVPQSMPELPLPEADVCADGLSLVLAGVRQVDVDSMVATRAIDDASWKYLFLRKKHSLGDSFPAPPKSTPLGEAVLD